MRILSCALLHTDLHAGPVRIDYAFRSIKLSLSDVILMLIDLSSVVVGRKKYESHLYKEKQIETSFPGMSLVSLLSFSFFPVHVLRRIF